MSRFRLYIRYITNFLILPLCVFLSVVMVSLNDKKTTVQTGKPTTIPVLTDQNP